MCIQTFHPHIWQKYWGWKLNSSAEILTTVKIPQKESSVFFMFLCSLEMLTETRGIQEQIRWSHDRMSRNNVHLYHSSLVEIPFPLDYNFSWSAVMNIYSAAAHQQFWGSQILILGTNIYTYLPWRCVLICLEERYWIFYPELWNVWSYMMDVIKLGKRKKNQCLSELVLAFVH